MQVKVSVPCIFESLYLDLLPEIWYADWALVCISHCTKWHMSWGPFSTQEEPGILGGGSYTGDFDRWMKEGSSGGASLCKGFHEGYLDRGFLYWGIILIIIIIILLLLLLILLLLLLLLRARGHQEYKSGGHLELWQRNRAPINWWGPSETLLKEQGSNTNTILFYSTLY